MPRKKWIDKKSAAHFNLVHRPQNDPLIHDDTLPSMILQQVVPPNANKPGRPKTLRDLEQELDLHPEQGDIRANEGEAANYGIFYDDSRYDYMQHLRDVGGAEGEVGFVDAMPVKFKGKGKAKMMSLEDALRKSTLNDTATDDGVSGSGSLFGEDFAPSQNLKKTTYQDQQDVPDVLAGFQPDMDPRLREALEALEDDAYVDDKDDEDVFAALVEGGKSDEVTPEEFEELDDFEGEDGWESDQTERPIHGQSIPLDPIPQDDPNQPLPPPPLDSTSPPDPSLPPSLVEDSPWLAEFSKFKQASKSQKQDSKPNPAAPSSLNTTSTTFKPLKKRKGALTASTSYSMTSSSLARTEGHRLLDSRFDRIEALYSLDEDDEIADDEDGGISIAPSTASRFSKASGISTASSNAPSLIEAQSSGALRSDFDDMMDEFLGGFPETKSGKSRAGSSASLGGKSVSKKERREGRYQNGMRMLDEVRGELGTLRVKGRV